VKTIYLSLDEAKKLNAGKELNLEDGWEPFAIDSRDEVINNKELYSLPMIWLKKYVKMRKK